MELRARAAARVGAVLLAALVALLVAAAPAGADELREPSSQTEPPRFFERSAQQAVDIARRSGVVRLERRRRPRMAPTAYTKGVGRWQVSWFDGDDEVAQVLVDDRSGAILEEWRGHQVAWTMARGYEGAFGRKLNAPYVWLPLCLLFLLPFVDPRRPFRLLHLDLLVLLGFGASHYFFNRGQIGLSAPLAAPVLVYLLVRCMAAGLRPTERQGSLVPYARASWLLVGAAFLLAFRAGLNVLDSNVIDVGYAGVIGADRIADGDPLYGPGFSGDVERGDTYGPLTYLLYAPFEQALPWSGSWDDLPAAHGAALAFDLLTALGLLHLGRRLRPGSEGRLLGAALIYAWPAYPYTAFALESNSNDTLVAVLCVAALLALTLEPARGRASALLRGAAVGLGAAAKFAPLALAPLFAGASPERRRRGALLFAAALIAALAATVLPFVPDGGLRELYDRTVGYQAGRPSPFSVWGQAPSLDWLHTAAKVGAGGLALLVAFVPRRKSPRQVAALGAAVLLALQLAASHWFYLYVVWFAPFVLVVLFTSLREPSPADAPRPAQARAELVPA